MNTTKMNKDTNRFSDTRWEMWKFAHTNVLRNIGIVFAAACIAVLIIGGAWIGYAAFGHAC